MKILKKLISISLFNLFTVVSIVSAGTSISAKNIALPLPSPESQLAIKVSPKPFIRPAVSVSPSLSPSSKPSLPPPNNQCVIVIDGVKYNVTQFRKQHSGGDIFQCNVDMSQIFWARHNQAILQKMQQYRI